MIDRALGFLGSAMQRHFEAILGRGEQPYVSVSAFTRPDGTGAPDADQRVILMLVGVERETAGSPPTPSVMRAHGEGYASMMTSLPLNLFVLLASQHANYPEALKRLAVALGFVQTHPVLDPRSAPGFPDGISRLSLELVNLDFHALNNIWAMTGARYQPSVLIKMRMPAIDLGRIDALHPAVHAVEPTAVPSDAGGARE